MALLLLANHLGDITNGSSAGGLSGSVSTGYNINDLISGPRSTLVRTDASTSNIGLAFTTPSSITPTHCVIARADYLLTTQAMRLRLRERDGAGTWTYVSGIDYNPLTAASLIGIRSQDLCIPFTPAQTRGFGISALTAGISTECVQVSKMYFSTSFNFGTNPLPGAQWEPTKPKQRFRPIYGYYEHEIEARITFNWNFISASKIQQWRALPQLLNWPLFLYDENADFWEYKLEHVLVADFSEQLMANDLWSVSITFVRLKHYA